MPLCTRSIRNVAARLSRVIFVLSREDWYHLITTDAAFADRANHRVSRLVHPLVDAFPAVQMAARSHNRLSRLIEANVALEHIVCLGALRPLLFLLLFIRIRILNLRLIVFVARLVLNFLIPGHSGVGSKWVQQRGGIVAR